MAHKTIERRYVSSEFQVRSVGGKTVVEGHAAVFNKRSQNLGGFVEMVAPGAFTKTIQEADVRALFNHDPSMILGRSTAGTLRLAQDNIGLAYEIDLGTRSYERDLAESMERGDITQSSFGFRVIDDDFGYTEDDFPLRTLTEVALTDVSPVTYPAYLDADSGIASRAIARLAETRGLDPAQAYDLRALIDGSASPFGVVPPDDDTDPGPMAQSVDACIDAAVVALAAGQYESVKALLDAADTALDELLGVLGVDDPDEGARAALLDGILKATEPDPSTRTDQDLYARRQAELALRGRAWSHLSGR
jgi:HK97 family phage prohead protease